MLRHGGQSTGNVEAFLIFMEKQAPPTTQWMLGLWVINPHWQQLYGWDTTHHAIWAAGKQEED